MFEFLKSLINSRFESIERRRPIGHVGKSHQGNRDYYNIYGYDKVISSHAVFDKSYAYYRRMGIANRIVKYMPKTCWRDGFNILESDDSIDPILKDEFDILYSRGMLRKLEAADILNRLGRFSCLFVGIPDGRDPSEPLGTATGTLDQVYFKAFGYDGIEIAKLDQDPRSPRYGLPELYTVQRMDRGDTEKDTTTNSLIIHYTRVIHMVEYSLDSDIEGLAELEPIFNRLHDIDKATGGASEAYFRNARRIITAEIDPDFSASFVDRPEERQMYDQEMSKFSHGWADNITAVGTKINQLQASHYSPLDTVRVSLYEIAAHTGLPLRILIGEGAGQLAGAEDRLTVNILTFDRQKGICTLWVNKLLEIFSSAGMIELPEKHVIKFPTQRAVTEIQQADIGYKKAATLREVVTVLNTTGDSIDVKSMLHAMGLETIKVDDAKLQELIERKQELEEAQIESKISTDNASDSGKTESITDGNRERPPET